ncbi:MAG: flagellar brake protein [Betaproteobacteria bacterium]|nr:flagellar brake protein [Betaproteobacteria bacterium]MDE2132550.1 flagellar brake protein [Betaproteobacteria bacterium]
MRANKQANVAGSDLVFAPEGDDTSGGSEQGWKILIVDDEADVHQVTQLVLQNFTFEGRPLQFLNAYSGAEAFDLMREHPDTAVVLLDVVMETDDAGLVFARRVRTELDNRAVRLVLRTGQPGQYPEQLVMTCYDVNDYKSKTELTAQQVSLAITSGLRNYRDLIVVDRSHRETREKMLAAVAQGLRRSGEWAGAAAPEAPALEQLIEGVLQQARAALDSSQDPMFLRSPAPEADAAPQAETPSAPPPEQENDPEFSEYELATQSDTRAILRDLCEEGALITFHFNQGRDFLLTSLLDVSEDGHNLIFDLGSSRDANRKILQADRINAVTSRNRIKIRFTLDGLAPVRHEGRDAFWAHAPEALFRLQRRENYRIAAPLANPIKARIPVRQENGPVRTAQAVLYDISGGGVSLVAALGDVDFRPGTEFFGVSLNLPQVGMLTVDLLVRNIYDITAPGGKVLRRAGCEFMRLPGPTMSLIQRYIIQTERERLTR